MNIDIHAHSDFGKCTADKKHIEFTASASNPQAYFSVDFSLKDWEEDAYVMMPSCAYNANRFKRVVRSYPPMYSIEEAEVCAEPLMTDVPALNPDGSGCIQVTTGDMATPCVGIFYRHSHQAMLIFFRQQVKGVNIGVTFSKAGLTLSYPAHRDDLYRFCRPHEKFGDVGIAVEEGETVTSDYIIFEFDCDDMEAFFKMYFEKRKCLLSDARAENGYTDELWNIMEKHFNEHNWSGEYYAEASKIWQCGWVGGGISTYPMLIAGSALSRSRAVQTIDFMTSHQAESGFYFGIIKDGKIGDDSMNTPGMENIHMVRKSSDGLYFLLKTFDIMTPKQSWIDSARRCADALVKTYKRYGTFGQFVDVNTGEMRVGGSCAGAMAVGALAKASVYFKNDEYLKVAESACEYYLDNFISKGFTLGGPGEILCAPDSETAFAMVESCMALYEVTGDKKWLRATERCVHLASTWVVSYRYRFPESSEFNRLNINTVGCVFANVQNKHAAPGICTLSGDSIYKLYKYTGNIAYLELIRDIASCIPQCVATDARPIYSWDNPPEKLVEGYVCERVNMSDWEGFEYVGGVFNNSCWCETSLILSFVELMKYDEFCQE